MAPTGTTTELYYATRVEPTVELEEELAVALLLSGSTAMCPVVLLRSFLSCG